MLSLHPHSVSYIFLSNLGKLVHCWTWNSLYQWEKTLTRLILNRLSGFGLSVSPPLPSLHHFMKTSIFPSVLFVCVCVCVCVWVCFGAFLIFYALYVFFKHFTVCCNFSCVSSIRQLDLNDLIKPLISQNKLQL